MSTIFFEQAMAKASSCLVESTFSFEITLIRDQRGRIRFLIEGDKQQRMDSGLQAFLEELSGALGRYGYPPDKMALYTADFSDSRLWASRRNLAERRFVLDNEIIGHDWLEPQFKPSKIPRFTFFGVKGGVGRSTTQVLLAWMLAKNGHRVLIFDLDLESPGVSSTLLPVEALPDYGLVDWFVEDGVGQGELVEPDIVARSPLTSGLSGEIMVVPAYGRKTGGYLPKLNRCYAGITVGEQRQSWADRLAHIVERMEQRVNPDLVFLDSRAGIHDIAAIALTRMGAQCYLFTADSQQSWTAYKFLFQHWTQHANLQLFRENLQMVGCLVPETNRKDYLTRLCLNAWDVFRELYDDIDATVGGFNFDLHDQQAPHFPIPIYWQRALQEFDPTHRAGYLDEEMAYNACGNMYEAILSTLAFKRGGE